MHEAADIYDLGEVAAAPAVRPRRSRFGPPTAVRPLAGVRGPGLSGTLALFVPGAGQLIRGQVGLGLFFLAWTGFLSAFVWAVLATFDRIAPTLALFEMPLAVPFGVLAASYALAATLHVASVVHATAPVSGGDPPRPHPVISGVASGLIPGWGQILNGDRVRSALFLTAAWTVAGVWVAGSPSATGFFNTHLPAVSPWEQALRVPFVAWTARFTLPAVIWILAVYDAAASAAHSRR